jgi:hypothetical protein
MRELSGLRRRFVPYVLGPAIGPVDDIEQPPTHDHGTGGRGDLFEDLGVDRVLLATQVWSSSTSPSPCWESASGPVT